MGLNTIQARIIKQLRFALAVTTMAGSLMACSALTYPASAADIKPSGFVFTEENSDPKAVEIATKLFKNNIQDMISMDPNPPRVFAQFVKLGPDLPKNSVIAQFMHASVCSAHDCEIVFFENVDGKSQYRIVMDNNFGSFRFAPLPGEKYYQLRLPTATGTATTDTIWQMDPAKKQYTIRSGPRVGQ